MSPRTASLLGLPVALGGAAAALSLTSPAPFGPGLALGVGAAVALGTVPGVLLGLLAVLVAVGHQLPGSASLPLAIAGVAGGVGIGLLAREIHHHVPRLVRGGAIGTALWLLIVASVVALLPDGNVLLTGPSGDPLTIRAVLLDVSSGVRVAADLPAWAHVAHPLSGAGEAVLLIAGLSGFAVLAGRVRSDRLVERLGWWLTVVAGLALLCIGLAGELQLWTGAAVDVPAVGDWVAQWSHAGDGRVAIDVASMPAEAFVGVGSRPGVDALRLVVAAAVVALGVFRLRPSSAPAPASRRRGGTPWLPLAIAATAVAIAGLAGAQASWLLLAAAAAGLGALASGAFVTVRARAPEDLVLVALGLSVFAWIAPMAGWIAP